MEVVVTDSHDWGYQGVTSSYVRTVFSGMSNTQFKSLTDLQTRRSAQHALHGDSSIELTPNTVRPQAKALYLGRSERWMDKCV